MPKTEIPKFNNESQEADWWASPAGRTLVKRNSKALDAKGRKAAGSRLVAELNARKGTRVAIRLPAAELEQARRIAGRKGVGYRALLEELVHEGLRREARRGISAG